MYNKIECIRIACDNCGETFVDDHSGFSIYVDQSSAWSDADNSGWYPDHGKHYCPLCHCIDDEDNLIVNEARKK